MKDITLTLRCDGKNNINKIKNLLQEAYKYAKS